MKCISLLLVLSAAQAFTVASRVQNSRLVQRSGDKVAVFPATKVQLSKSTVRMSAAAADIEVEVVAKAAPSSNGLLDKVWNENTKLGFYLAVWYLGNIYYNIWNKKACIALGKNAAGASNAHWALSAVQVNLPLVSEHRSSTSIYLLFIVYLVSSSLLVCCSWSPSGEFCTGRLHFLCDVVDFHANP